VRRHGQSCCSQLHSQLHGSRKELRKISERGTDPSCPELRHSRRPNAHEGEAARLIDSDLAMLKRQLQESTNTVTEFLQELFGEVIVADVVRQHSIVASTDNDLNVAPGEAVIHRIAVLKGSRTRRSFLLAESLFAPDRLPGPVRSKLAEQVEPIGRVLIAHDMRLAREPLAQPEPFDERNIYSEVDLASDVVWSRAYRLMMPGKPVFVIREWFLQPVLEALSRQVRRLGHEAGRGSR
jgi:chorismate-pyruvate lyase